MTFKLIKEKNPVKEHVKVPFIITLIGSWFFIGFAPLATGTLGSLAAFGIYLLPHVSEVYYIALITVVFFVIGLYCSQRMRARYGEDPPEVVIDEVVGMWFTYLIGSLVFEMFFSFKSFDPAVTFQTKLAFAVIGFIVFRVLDIIKLEPAKYFDNKDSGFGIMMDDVISGFYAGIFSAVLTHLAWYQFLRKFLS
jgi:phosphatidylglycerophosphatase A